MSLPWSQATLKAEVVRRYFVLIWQTCSDVEAPRAMGEAFVTFLVQALPSQKVQPDSGLAAGNCATNTSLINPFCFPPKAYMVSPSFTNPFPKVIPLKEGRGA